jgi:uncharacterized protein YfbU (UPF0304 family)
MATLTVRLTDEAKNGIEEAAEARGLQVSDYVREALEMYQRLERSDEVGADRPDESDDVALTPYQRKVLQLLHRNLLATRGDLNDSYYDREQEVQALKVLESGFVGEYPAEFGDISEQTSRTECELVWDILDMFRVIQFSVKKFGKQGWAKTKVEDAEYYGTFKGFDFNDSVEGRLAHYAEFLINSGRWTEQKEAFGPENDMGNSHSQMLPRYRAMLRTFKPLWRQTIRRGVGSGYFSAEEVRKVLLAAPGARAEGE